MTHDDAVDPGPADTTPGAAGAHGVGTSGLTTAEAAARLAEDGPNTIGGGGRRTLAAILVAQVASPLVLILVAASLVSLVVGDAVTAAIILAIVAMSAALGLIQEARSESAVAALQARLTLRATVVRNGAPVDVPIHDVVRDDLVVLGAGDIVPADGRVIEADHLYVDEASLTGESAAALKTPPLDGKLDPASEADRDGLVFFGTSVVSGTGRAVVTATGSRTSYGEIAQRLGERAPENDFQRGVRAFGGLIFRVTTILVIAVLAINLILQRPLLDSLLFAIALAVGLTPELLPAIVTLNLTQGARALSRHGVLVKRLPAIQNLGCVTVLCTDKTGTLTDGHLQLVRSVGIDRDDATEAARALELAYLNSRFETGFTQPAGRRHPRRNAGAGRPRDLPEDRGAPLRLHAPPAQRRRPGRRREHPLLVTKGAPEAVIARADPRPRETTRPGRSSVPSTSDWPSSWTTPRRTGSVRGGRLADPGAGGGRPSRRRERRRASRTRSSSSATSSSRASSSSATRPRPASATRSPSSPATASPSRSSPATTSSWRVTSPARSASRSRAS